MRIAILGICGTFMAGVAAIAKQAGHSVIGYDQHVYPPMSDQLRLQGITLIEGYPDTPPENIDCFVIGNAISRGNPLLETILEKGLPYNSGPQWLGEQCLHQKWVLGIAGTHGKTTTSAMLAWILEASGYAPGFLIGGVPVNLGITARISESAFFVIEADEYDTAFFDKRSKFVHYRPRTFIINNLEYDHADIFPDLAAIQRQFHHAVRAMPRNAQCIVNAADASIEEVLKQGCWSEVARFGAAESNTIPEHDWSITASGEVLYQHASQGHMPPSIIGQHNRMNALAALAAAYHVGVRPKDGLAALESFKGVKRRLEILGEINGVRVIDDFAHHPTAIAATINALRSTIPSNDRIIAVFEPRSNTMKLGAMRALLADSLKEADQIYAYTHGIAWDVGASLQALGKRAATFDDLTTLTGELKQILKPGDHVLMMSNGAFGGIHARLLDSLSH
ncbi:MAG: UDP-N-acetylmuramate:L-alanyl-gamma-D-glutamyl-meso-diaminopimelate ligase [Pseudomonadota bacterium]